MTMEEIRREARSPHSYLRINTLDISAVNSADAPHSPSYHNSRTFHTADYPAAPNNNRSAAVTAESHYTAPVPERHDSNISHVSSAIVPPSHVDHPTPTMPIRPSFPQRTTSNVMHSSTTVPLPPSIDTHSPEIQRNRAQAVRSASGKISSKLAATASAAITDDSDASVPMGTNISDKGAFDSPIPAVQSQSPLPMSAPLLPPVPEDSNKRVISAKIKNLANRFSSSNVSDESSKQGPSMPSNLQRRPSNSPSVSERVSLFDQQDIQSRDPRSSSLFGKFGMASTVEEVSTRHNRSSSIAGTLEKHRDTRNNNSLLQPNSAPIDNNNQQQCNAVLTEISTIKPTIAEDSDNGSDMSVVSSPKGDGSGKKFSSFGKRIRNRVASLSGHSGSSITKHNATVENRSESAIAPLSTIQPRPSIKSKISFDHQLSSMVTKAGGVQLDSVRRFSESDTQSIDGDGVVSGLNSMYHGQPVGDDGTIKRKGSILSTFDGSIDDDFGIGTTADPVETTNSYGYLASSSNNDNNQFGTQQQASRSGSFRRAGSVVPSYSATTNDSTASHRDGYKGSHGNPRQPLRSAANAGSLFDHLLHKVRGSVDADADATDLSQVDSVIISADSGSLLTPDEYERYVNEAALLKSRLQSARTQRTLDVRRRDVAKENLDQHKSSSSGNGVARLKGKRLSHTFKEEYNQASSKVQQVEVEISELSTKLRFMESSLREHQVTVLLSAIKRVVSEASHFKSSSDDKATVMNERVSELEQKLEESQAFYKAERDSVVADFAHKRVELETKLRDLQNQSHDVSVRHLSTETEKTKSDSLLAQHSASLTMERLSGELTVLKEQKLTSEQQVKILENRLDEALLCTRETQQELEDVRRQSNVFAIASKEQAQKAQESIARHSKCFETFAAGLGSMVAPLRVLEDIRAATSISSVEAVDRDVFPKGIVSIDMLEDTLRTQKSNRVSGEDKKTIGVSKEWWNPDEISAAMALLAATIDGCATFYPEAGRVKEQRNKLQKELETEKRLREAQGLAITQQRDRLSKAQYLSSSAEQRIREATETLLADHNKEKQQWAEEKRRLFDNIERLTRDAQELKSSTSAAVSFKNVGSLEKVDPATDSMIEQLSAQVTALREESDATGSRLKAETEHSSLLRQKLEATGPLREQVRELSDAIERQQQTEAILRKQLADSIKDNRNSSTTHLGESREDGEQLVLSESVVTAVEGYNSHLQLTATEPIAFSRSLIRRCNSLSNLDKLVGSSNNYDHNNALGITNSTDTLAMAGSSDMAQVVQAYSEKLIQKEDVLHSREDELETIRAEAAEIECALKNLLPSPLLLSTDGSYSLMGASGHNSSPRLGSNNLRNRSASLFYSWRGNSSQTNSNEHPLVSSRDGSPRVVGKSVEDGGTLLAIRDLMPIVQKVSVEVKRLKTLIGEVDQQSREAQVELMGTQKQLNELRGYCSSRAKQEDVVQQDLTHILGQMSGLREKVVQLENERAEYEEEANKMRRRCREMENNTAERVLQHIVDQVGKRSLSSTRNSLSPYKDKVADERTDSAPTTTTSSSSSPSRFAAVSAITISHPEAGDIRSEFNELLNQIISRRDEDIERLQTLADAWRESARKSYQYNERKTWNRSTRGIQTV